MINLANKAPLGLKKEKTKKNPKYLDKIRERPCCVCQKFGEKQMSPTTAHHVIHDRFSTRKRMTIWRFHYVKVIIKVYGLNQRLRYIKNQKNGETVTATIMIIVHPIEFLH